jgi:hypothetical protein
MFPSARQDPPADNLKGACHDANAVPAHAPGLRLAELASATRLTAGALMRGAPFCPRPVAE